MENVVQISKDIVAQIVDNTVLQYYTVIYCPEGMDNCWYGTGILEPIAEEALKTFATYTSVGRFHLVRIDVQSTAGQ